MKVLALIENPDHVCYRYRIEAFASVLAQWQLFLEVVPLGRSPLLRLGQLYSAGRAEVVILQRKLLPFWQLRILRRAAPRLVYDIDDALFQRDSFHRKGPKSWSRQFRFRVTTQAADAVIVGNRYLKRCAATAVQPDRIHVVPTTVQPTFYSLARHHRLGSGVKLVWIGSSSTLKGLKLAEPHLAAAAEKLPGLEMRLICDRGLNLSGLRVELRPWSSATEATELAAGDIGISWLSDSSWSRGKCGLKVLQYMAAGLPVVANPVGMNREMVFHGRTGLLASTPGQWAQAIATLAADPELRRTMGGAGRRLVEERYDVAQWGPRFAALIDGVARGRVRADPDQPASFPLQSTFEAGEPSLVKAA